MLGLVSQTEGWRKLAGWCYDPPVSPVGVRGNAGLDVSTFRESEDVRPASRVMYTPGGFARGA